MPNLLIGKDYAGVSAVKVTKDAFDPKTTPDSNVGAFLYNSISAADMKITAVIDPAVSFGAVGTGSFYLPVGANAGNAEAACNSQSEYLYAAYRMVFTGEEFYQLPLFDVKTFNTQTARFVQGRMRRNTYGTQDRGIEYLYSTGGLWYKDFYNTTTPWFTGTKDNMLSLGWNKGGAYGYEKQIGVVWRLPGTDTAIVDGALQAPVSGQETIKIGPGSCRVAKPGFDVNSATKTQLAIDSSSNPAKVIAAMDVAVPVGASSVNLGFSLPAGVVADVHFYSGSTVYYPINPVTSVGATIIGADYWFSGNAIHFSNAGVACRARFIVYAYDTAGQTAGNGSVVRQFTADGVGVVQLVRPGASDNPSFADILVDTRWPSLRMIAEGYLPVTANGEQTYTVNFNSDGMLPMVRFVTFHGAYSTGPSYGYSAEVRVPRVRVVYINPQEHPVYGVMGGDSSFCTLTPTAAVFKTYRGNPTRIYYSSGSNAESDTRSYIYDTNQILGIRYFIFGIPQP